MQRTFSPCYIPDMHWKQISAPYPPYPVISCLILIPSSLMSNFLELSPTVQALPRPEDVHVTSRYITLPPCHVERLFFHALYNLYISILYSFHFIPFLVAASAALKSHCPATLGGLLGLLLHLQPRTMRKNDAPKISKMMRYDASKIFKFGRFWEPNLKADPSGIHRHK